MARGGQRTEPHTRVCCMGHQPSPAWPPSCLVPSSAGAGGLPQVSSQAVWVTSVRALEAQRWLWCRPTRLTPRHRKGQSSWCPVGGDSWSGLRSAQHLHHHGEDADVKTCSWSLASAPGHAGAARGPWLQQAPRWLVCRAWGQHAAPRPCQFPSVEPAACRRRLVHTRVVLRSRVPGHWGQQGSRPRLEPGPLPCAPLPRSASPHPRAWGGAVRGLSALTCAHSCTSVSPGASPERRGLGRCLGGPEEQ